MTIGEALEKYTWRLAQDFCALNTHVTLLTTGKILAPFTHPLLNIVSFPFDHQLSVLQLLHFDKACRDYLQAHPYAIVFSLDRTRFSTHIRAGNGAHAAYLQERAKEEGWIKSLSFHLNPLHQALLSLEKTAFEHPHLQRLFTNSHMVRHQILARFATKAEKISVIHNGVEWKELQDPFDAWEERKTALLAERGLDPSAFHFLFSGHNYKRKGLNKLLAALALIKDEPFQLSIVGKEKNLRLYRAMTASLRLENKVFFFGPMPSMIPFYQYADAMVIPSLYDPFANVTVEALAMGLFVLSSKANGGSEVIPHDSGTILEDIHDPSYFASALQKALRHHKTAKRAQGIRGGIQHLDFSLQLRKMTEKTLSL